MLITGPTTVISPVAIVAAKEQLKWGAAQPSFYGAASRKRKWELAAEQGFVAPIGWPSDAVGAVAASGERLECRRDADEGRGKDRAGEREEWDYVNGELVCIAVPNDYDDKGRGLG